MVHDGLESESVWSGGSVRSAVKAAELLDHRAPDDVSQRFPTYLNPKPPQNLMKCCERSSPCFYMSDCSGSGQYLRKPYQNKHRHSWTANKMPTERAQFHRATRTLPSSRSVASQPSRLVLSAITRCSKLFAQVAQLGAGSFPSIS